MKAPESIHTGLPSSTRTHYRWGLGIIQDDKAARPVVKPNKQTITFGSQQDAIDMGKVWRELEYHGIKRNDTLCLMPYEQPKTAKATTTF